MVPVTTILRDAEESCDFPTFDGSPAEWKRMMMEKANDSGFGDLIDAILDNGWEEGSAVGFDGSYINEGHHRIVAAILLGMDEVPVADWGLSTGTLSAHDGYGSGRDPIFDLYDDAPTGWGCSCGCED